VYVQVLGHRIGLNTIGAKVMVVENVKYLGVNVAFPEEQTALASPHLTWRLPMV
jgi:hypothetical protein